MTAASLALVAVSLLAADDHVPSTPVSVSMVAVEGRREGRAQKYFDPGLESVRRALADLDFDTFYKIQNAQLPCPYGEEQKIYINKRYTLYITPESVRDDGRIRLRARVTMRSRDGTRDVDALDTTLLIAPGGHLNLGGMKLEQGELIVVISVK